MAPEASQFDSSSEPRVQMARPDVDLSEEFVSRVYHVEGDNASHCYHKIAVAMGEALEYSTSGYRNAILETMADGSCSAEFVVWVHRIHEGLLPIG